MISILAWRLSSLRPQRLGAIRCINAKILVTSGEGGDAESFLPGSRELLISLKCIQLMHQTSVIGEAEVMNLL